MTTWSVELTNREILMGAVMGIIQAVQAIQEGSKMTHGSDRRDRWRYSIEGCLSEVAVAKCLDRYMSGFSTKRTGDLSQGIEVRCTDHEDGHLIVRLDDDSDKRYVLVVGMQGQYELMGWMPGEDAKQEQFLKDPTGYRPPAFFVPQEALNKMEELKDDAR